jgi:peptide deformylase
MLSPFVKPNDPVLKKVAQLIDETELNSGETKAIIQKMLSVALGEQQDPAKPLLVGLAAPQIGISRRIILVDIKADGRGGVGELKIFINPEIIWQSNEKDEWYEGCFSTDRVCGIVSRPTGIRIRAFTVSQPGFEAIQPPVLEAKRYFGYIARIFQHEIDHLNGIRFPDLITDPEKLHWVEKAEFPLYRDQQAWKDWPKKCTFEKWTNL